MRTFGNTTPFVLPIFPTNTIALQPFIPPFPPFGFPTFLFSHIRISHIFIFPHTYFPHIYFPTYVFPTFLLSHIRISHTFLFSHIIISPFFPHNCFPNFPFLFIYSHIFCHIANYFPHFPISFYNQYIFSLIAISHISAVLIFFHYLLAFLCTTYAFPFIYSFI